MSYQGPGIKALGICTKGTLGSTKTNQFILGLRNNVTLEIEPFDTVADHRGRNLKNKLKFSITGESFQGLTSLAATEASSIALIKVLADHAILNGVDAELIGEGATWNSGTSKWDTDVFQFQGSYFLGMDFIFELTDKVRKTKLTLEAAFDHSLAHTNITLASGTASSTLFVTSPINKGFAQTSMAVPTFLVINLPEDSAYSGILPELLTSFSMSIKNSGEKSIYDRTLTEYFEFDIKLSLKNLSNASDVDQLQWFTARTLLESFRVVQYITSAITDIYVFETNALSSSPKIHISDDKRFIEVFLKGKCTYGDLAFNTTTAYTALTETLTAITAGTISLTINGVAYTEDYSTDAATTCENFQVSHIADLATAGVTCGNPSDGVLTFAPVVSGDSFTFVETSPGTNGVWTKSAAVAAKTLTVSA